MKVYPTKASNFFLVLLHHNTFIIPNISLSHTHRETNTQYILKSLKNLLFFANWTLFPKWVMFKYHLLALYFLQLLKFFNFLHFQHHHVPLQTSLFVGFLTFSWNAPPSSNGWLVHSFRKSSFLSWLLHHFLQPLFPFFCYV